MLGGVYGTGIIPSFAMVCGVENYHLGTIMGFGDNEALFVCIPALDHFDQMTLKSGFDLDSILIAQFATNQ